MLIIIIIINICNSIVNAPQFFAHHIRSVSLTALMDLIRHHIAWTIELCMVLYGYLIVMIVFETFLAKSKTHTHIPSVCII